MKTVDFLFNQKYACLGYPVIITLLTSNISCLDEVSPCDTNPCLNEATCIVEYSKYKCLCKAGYKGLNCEGKCYENIK